jgi:hypothetical protein
MLWMEIWAACKAETGQTIWLITVSRWRMVAALVIRTEGTFSRPSDPSASNPYHLKVIPFDGGVASYQVAWPVSASVARWAPAGDAVEYALTRNGVSNIWRQKLGGGPPKQITEF